MDELWTLLVDAQAQPSGIPLAFIQQKSAEILKRQEQQKHTTINSPLISYESTDGT